MSNCFPEDFVFGCAAASYQVEGATHEGGREECIWDVFARRPGAVYCNMNGDVAIDQYHRYKEDIDLMKKLNMQSYRFSISWCRIIKRDGSVNEEGISYYRNLASYLHEKGMTAAATLYHWDLPQYLEDKGGWRNRDIVYAFEHYASVCFERLGDVVDMWITMNEPWCISYLSHYHGAHAPGYKDLAMCGPVIHHINLAHGLAVRKHRELKLNSSIGITWNAFVCVAAPYVEDKKGLEQRQFDLDTGVFTDPVFKGYYPAEAEKYLNFPVEDGDMEIIHQKIDFYGLNYYHEDIIEESEVFPFYKCAPMYVPVTGMDWPVTPEGLTHLLERMNKESGGIDVYITENGAAYDDVLTVDNRIHDLERVSFVKEHFKAALEAIKEGVPLKGFYEWSFTDNYEWAYGYSKRFGVVYIDYWNLKRYPKDSAYYLATVAERRCIV